MLLPFGTLPTGSLVAQGWPLGPCGRWAGCSASSSSSMPPWEDTFQPLVGTGGQLSVVKNLLSSAMWRPALHFWPSSGWVASGRLPSPGRFLSVLGQDGTAGPERSLFWSSCASCVFYLSVVLGSEMGPDGAMDGPHISAPKAALASGAQGADFQVQCRLLSLGGARLAAYAQSQMAPQQADFSASYLALYLSECARRGLSSGYFCRISCGS